MASLPRTKTNPNNADPIEAAYWAGVEAGMRRYLGDDADDECGVPCSHPGFMDGDGVDVVSAVPRKVRIEVVE